MLETLTQPTRLTRLLAGAAALLVLGACEGAAPEADAPEADDIARDERGLVGGTTTSLRPEVGRFWNGRGGACTATLIHERYVLTAAHCLDYPDYQNVAVLAGTQVQIAGTNYAVDRIHSFAYSRYEYTQSGDRTTDLALLRLSTAVPSTSATPARLATRMPRSGERVTLFGFGCTNRSPQSGGGSKQYFEFDFPSATQALCPGDSGGPAFIGSRTAGGELWGVNSDYSGSGTFSTWDDIFGDVTGRKVEIEAIIRYWEGDNTEPGFDRPGADYRSLWIYTNDVRDCRRECEQDPQCRAYTYRAPNASSSYGYCWLKNKITPMRPLAGFTSGTIGAVKSGLGFSGGFSSFTPSPATAEACAQACSQNASCQSWRFSGTTCTFSAAHETLSVAAGSAAGHRQPARETNTDRWGADYRSFATSSANTCERTCAREARCAAFTHYSGTCFLKETEGAPSTLSAATSGVRRGLESNTDRPGSDYRNFVPSSPDPEHCQAACASESSCKAFTYVPPSGSSSARCFLKSQVAGAYNTDGMRSGYRFVFGSLVSWVDDEPNMDRPGGDLSSLWSSSWASCKSSCQANGSCRAWTWIPPRNGESAWCALKSSIPSPRSTNNMVSGLKGLEFLR